MKGNEEVMEILEAFDLTQSYEAAARLAGCDAKTVARYVAARDCGNTPFIPAARDRTVDPYVDKIEEWVDHSNGDIRADVCHRKLRALGYTGSERTTRRAVASAKAAYVRGHRRVYRPWVVEPGLWFQWDWGTGPVIRGRATQLWCAWLAWSRFRVIIPTWDKTLPTVVACLDETLRAFQGVPTYGLTDNEKTVTTERVCGIAVRHPTLSPRRATTVSQSTPVTRPIPSPRAARRRRCASPRPTSCRRLRICSTYTSRSASSRARAKRRWTASMRANTARPGVCPMT